MELYAIIRTGIYSIPIIVGGIYFEKNPVFMGSIMIIGCILIAVKLGSELKTAEARRRHVGYGDLK